MRKMLESIVNNLWNGKATIIQHNKSTNTVDFLSNDVRNAIIEKYSHCIILDIFPDSNMSSNLVNKLSATLDLVKDNKVVFLIHGLFYYFSPTAIINMFYGKENVAAVMTADIDVSYYLKDKDTQVRGRYDKYFLPPELYGDVVEKKDYHLGALLEFFSKEEAGEIYKYLVRHSGEVLTFRSVFEEVSVGKTLPFYIEAINYMNKAGMLYILDRVAIKDGKILSSGVVFYPTFVSDIDLTDLPEDKKFKLKNEAYLVAKMFDEDYKVSRAISYYSDTIDGKYKSRVEFNRGFLVEYHDRKCVIRIDFNDNEDMMERFKKAKSNIPHMVAVLGQMELRIDVDGIAYYGLENLLKKGLKGYGGF